MSLEPPGFAIVWKRVMGSQAEPHPRNWRTSGRSLIGAKGCLSCHELNAADVKRPTAPVPLDPKRVDRGCLAEMPNPNGPAPRYSLRTDERAALRDFIAAPHPKSPSPAPAFAAGLALRRFNCLACHQHDGEGGLSPDQAEELHRYEKADNADSAVPPPLTAVAHKLLTSALPACWSIATRAAMDGITDASLWHAQCRIPGGGVDSVGRGGRYGVAAPRGIFH